MTRAEKTVAIQELTEKFADAKYFYITDCSELTVEKINNIRRACFEENIQLKVVKNTLIKKALKGAAETTEENYEELYEVLKGPSALMFTDKGNAPAKLIKKFRKELDRPVLKAAYIESEIYVGDDQVETLSAIKSKEELIADVILLLESPIKNVLGSLQSGGNTLSGLLKALEEKADA